MGVPRAPRPVQVSYPVGVPLPTFELTRSTLRPWRRDDLASLLASANDPAVSRSMTDRFPYPYTRADAEAWLAFATGLGHDTNLAIVRDGRAVGGIGVIEGQQERRLRAEIGYWLGTAHWNQGVATEAVRALSEHLLARPELRRLEANVYSDNPASGRVLEKAGYTLESIQRQGAIKRGEVLDVHVYVRLADR